MPYLYQAIRVWAGASRILLARKINGEADAWRRWRQHRAVQRAARLAQASQKLSSGHLAPASA